MRSYIFTEREREKLERWMETGEADRHTMNLFKKMRENTPPLREDLELMVLVLKKKASEKRGRGYNTGKTEYGSALRRVESALTRIRRGGATSGAWRR
jgi:hypothetical protein